MKYSLFLLISIGLFSSCATKSRRSTSEESRVRDSLAFELCKMYGGDQLIREPFITGGKVNWDYIQQLDTINFTKAITFVKTHGYPTKALVGEQNFTQECVASSLMAILLHSPHLIVNDDDNFRLLLSEVNKGNLNREIFAAILDKGYLMQKKYKYVLYGTPQFGMPCRSIKERTNKARKEIGLLPLADSLFVDCQ